MPSRDATEEARPSVLPAILFWIGIGLVPIATFLLLAGGDAGSLRAAMLVVLLVVLLIGASTALRGRAGDARRGMQRALFDEIDQLRGELRTDIGSAVRLTHRSHADQLQALQGNLAVLRAQLEGVRAELARVTSVGTESRPDGPAPASRVYGTAPFPRATGPVEDPPVTGATGWTGSVTTDRTGAGRAWSETGHQQPGRYGESWPSADPSPGDRYLAGRQVPGHPAVDPGPVEDPLPGTHIPGGVVRHTETVRVTTRQTIVGPPGPDPTQTGTHTAVGYQVDPGYGRHTHPGGAHPVGPESAGGHSFHPPGAGDEWRQPAPGGWSAEPAGSGGWSAEPAGSGGWSAEPAGYRWPQPPADQWGPQPAAGHWAPESGPAQQAWSATGYRAGEQVPERVAEERRQGVYRPGADERRSDPHMGDSHRSALHMGDSWASGHADERGQEMRMGQRRASVRADGSGTRFQVEDRWAALRQEEAAGPTSWAEVVPSWAEPDPARAEPEQVRHRHVPAPVDRAASGGGRTRMTASERFDRGRR